MTPKKKNYIVGIGETLWDVFPEGKKLGGAPANFAYHVSQSGLDGIAVSAVGLDSLGTELIDCLKAKGLDFYMEPVDYPTGTVQVTVDKAGVPQYCITEGAAWDNLEFTPELETIARNAQAVCFGSLAQRSEKSRATVRKFVETMDGGYRVFDINLRQHFYEKEVLADSMRLCNILKINDEEIEVVSQLFDLGKGGYESRCRELMARFDIGILILTCGVEGSHIFTEAGGKSFIPTPKVEVVDTVGAGDSFTAAFVSAIIKGKTVEEAHREAVGLSAYVCSCEGAMPCHLK